MKILGNEIYAQTHIRVVPDSTIQIWPETDIRNLGTEIWPEPEQTCFGTTQHYTK